MHSITIRIAKKTNKTLKSRVEMITRVIISVSAIQKLTIIGILG